MLGAIEPALTALCAGSPASDRHYVIAGSAPGGQFLNDVITESFDTGQPLPPDP